MGRFEVPKMAVGSTDDPKTAIRPVGRLVYDVAGKCLRIHDGATAGGSVLLTEASAPVAVSMKSNGATGANDPLDADKINTLFGTGAGSAPVESVISAPAGYQAYKNVAGSFYLKKKLHLNMGPGVDFRTDSTDPNVNCLNIDITMTLADVSPTTSGDVRGFRLSGGRYLAYVGGAAIAVGSAPGQYKRMTGGLLRDFSCYGARVGVDIGPGIHWLMIGPAEIGNGVLDRGEDGNLVFGCISLGDNPAVEQKDKAYGAFLHGLFLGTTSNRRGSFTTRNSMFPLHLFAQVEQGGGFNDSTYYAHINVKADATDDWPSVWGKVMFNNFGTGDNCKRVGGFKWARNYVFDYNLYNSSPGDYEDWFLDNSDPNAAPKGFRFGQNNDYRGPSTGAGAPRALKGADKWTNNKRRENIEFATTTTVNDYHYECWNPDVFGFLTSKIANLTKMGLAVYLDASGQVCFTGGVELSSGSWAAGTNLFDIPFWARSVQDEMVVAVSDTGALVPIKIAASNGRWSIPSGVTVGGTKLYLANVKYMAVVDPDYENIDHLFDNSIPV